MEEAYVMYQGLILVQEQQLNSITIVGDSKNIIQYISMRTTPNNTKMQRIIERIKSLMSPIQENSIHVLCRNNEEDNIMENQEIGLSLGHMNI